MSNLKLNLKKTSVPYQDDRKMAKSDVEMKEESQKNDTESEEPQAEVSKEEKERLVLEGKKLVTISVRPNYFMDAMAESPQRTLVRTICIFKSFLAPFRTEVIMILA